VRASNGGLNARKSLQLFNYRTQFSARILLLTADSSSIQKVATSAARFCFFFFSVYQTRSAYLRLCAYLTQPLTCSRTSWLFPERTDFLARTRTSWGPIRSVRSSTHRTLDVFFPMSRTDSQRKLWSFDHWTRTGLLQVSIKHCPILGAKPLSANVLSATLDHWHFTVLIWKKKGSANVSSNFSKKKKKNLGMIAVHCNFSDF
jgi:hypothetical protein